MLMESKFPWWSKKIFEVVDKPVVKNTKYNELNSKLNDSDDEISDASTLFQMKI